MEPGYVLRGCGKDAFTTLLAPTMHNNEKSFKHFAVALVTVYILGSYFQTALVLLMSAIFLHLKANKIAEYTAQSSYDHYGLFWGYVVTSLIGNTVLLVHGILLIKRHTLSEEFEIHLVASAHVVLMVVADSVILQLAREGEIEIRGPDGKVRSRSLRRLAPTDLIAFPENPIFPEFSRLPGRR